MKMMRLCKTAKIFMWTVVLVGLILSGAYTTIANPGLTPYGGSKTHYVDFSNFPRGSAIRQDLVAWQAQGWSGGARCLQLVRTGGYLEVVVNLPENVSTRICPGKSHDQRINPHPVLLPARRRSRVDRLYNRPLGRNRLARSGAQSRSHHGREPV
jgi:hypothetical protein